MTRSLHRHGGWANAAGAGRAAGASGGGSGGGRGARHRAAARARAGRARLGHRLLRSRRALDRLRRRLVPVRFPCAPASSELSMCTHTRVGPGGLWMVSNGAWYQCASLYTCLNRSFSVFTQSSTPGPALSGLFLMAPGSLHTCIRKSFFGTQSPLCRHCSLDRNGPACFMSSPVTPDSGSFLPSPLHRGGNVRTSWMYCRQDRQAKMYRPACPVCSHIRHVRAFLHCRPPDKCTFLILTLA